MGVYFAIWSWLAGLLRPRRSLPAPALRRNAGATNQPNELPPEARSPWLSSFRNLWLAFILAAGWTALEWVRSWMFTGWGWNGLGVALHDVLPIIQVAEFTGVAGLSFVVAFANVIRSRRCGGSWSRPRCACGGRITISPSRWRRLSASARYGIRLMQVKPRDGTAARRGGAGECAAGGKIQPRVPRKSSTNFTRLTRMALATQPPPQLIVWPESSTPAPALLDEENYRFVMDLSASIKTDLLLGTIDQDENRRLQRGLACLERRPEHSGLSQAASRALRRICPRPAHACRSLRGSSAIRSRLISTRGKEPVVFRLTTNQVKVAPLICFEDTIGELTRQFVMRGANLLANVTNDGWFLRSAGSTTASRERDFSLCRNPTPDGAGGEHRRDLFRQSIWPGHTSVARRARAANSPMACSRRRRHPDKRRADVLRPARRALRKIAARIVVSCACRWLRLGRTGASASFK